MAWRPLLQGLAVPTLLLGALEFYARGPGRGSDTLAAPSTALWALGQAALDGSLWSATAFTLGSAGLGLLIGCLLGWLFGALLGLSATAGHLASLTLELLRPIPSIALAPLAMLVFGFGWRMEIAIVAFAVFWPMVVLARNAARQIDPQWLELARALELGVAASLLKIVLPAMALRLLVALRLAVAVALVVGVTVEIASDPHGVGYAIMQAQQSLDPALMLGCLFWIALLGYGVNAAAVALADLAARRIGGRP